MNGKEQAWLPDLVFSEGRLESGVALVADANGKIVRLSRESDDLAGAERMAGRAILPGFVNAHSHSFQRAIRGRTEYRPRDGRDTFWTWREKMYHAANALTPEGIYATARMCFLEMALSGITTVGEFHYLHHNAGGVRYADPCFLAKEVVRAARDIGLRIALIQTGYERSGWKAELNPGQTRFFYKDVAEFLHSVTTLQADLARLYSKEDVWVGVAPHSLRAVTLGDFREINHFAQENRLPVHMHVSEQQGENADCLREYGKTPVALLNQEGLLHPGFTAIHAVHISEYEAKTLGEHWACVCACPTTERNLGDGIADANGFLAAGVNVALGSDSQIQIDLLEDARELEYHLRLKCEERSIIGPTNAADEDPDNLARILFRCTTTAGARALSFGGGDLIPGMPADFITVDLRDPSIAGGGVSLAAIVFGMQRTAIRDIAVGGKLIVRDGRHARQKAIVEQFETAQAGMWELR